MDIILTIRLVNYISSAPGNVYTYKVKAYIKSISEQGIEQFLKLIKMLNRLGCLGEPVDISEIAI